MPRLSPNTSSVNEISTPYLVNLDMGNRSFKEAMLGSGWVAKRFAERASKRESKTDQTTKRESKTDQTTTLLQQLSEKETELAEKDRELVDIKSQFIVLRGEHHRKLAGTNAELDQTKIKLAQTQASLDKVKQNARNDYYTYQRAKNELETKLKEKELDFDNQILEIKNLEESLKQKRFDYNKLHNDVVETIQSKERQIDKLEKDLEQTQMELKAANTKCEETNNALNYYRNRK